MNVHFLLLSCSALRANTACLLMNLHVISHLHPAAMAPASASPTSHCQPLHRKVLFSFSFLEHPPSAKHSQNLFQSLWAGRDPRDHVVPASAESWCSSWTSSAQAWRVPSPRHLHNDASSPPSPLFGPSPAPPSTQHPPHSSLWLGEGSLGLSEQHVHRANVSTGLPAAHFPGKGRERY